MTVSGRKYLLQSVAHPVNCTKTADVSGVWFSAGGPRFSEFKYTALSAYNQLVVPPYYSIGFTIEPKNRVT